MSLRPDIPAFIERKLRTYGRTFQVVRPIAPADPMSNVIGSTLAYPYREPRGHGNADWQIMLPEQPARPGDYLVAADGETYIYALRPHLMPAQAIRCTQSVALLRATPAPVGMPPAYGIEGYGGLCAAESDAALGTVIDGRATRGWPASILLGGGRQSAGVGLPMSVSNAGFEIMLPITIPVTLHASDVLIDTLGRRFIAEGCELSALGWRLAVREAHS